MSGGESSTARELRTLVEALQQENARLAAFAPPAYDVSG